MAKAKFRTGWSGSPFHTGYDANEGMNLGPGGKTSEPGPRIGPGAEGRRVTMEVDRDDSRAVSDRKGNGK